MICRYPIKKMSACEISKSKTKNISNLYAEIIGRFVFNSIIKQKFKALCIMSSHLLPTGLFGKSIDSDMSGYIFYAVWENLLKPLDKSIKAESQNSLLASG